MFASQKTLIDLEWQGFLKRVADRCAGEEAAHKVLSLPFLDEREARFHMKLVDEFVQCIDNDDAPPLLDARPCAIALKRIASGGSVDTEELLTIASNSRLFVDLCRYVENRKDRCAKNGSVILPEGCEVSPVSLSRLAAQIDGTFAPDGSIDDFASPDLARLRKRAVSLRKNLLTGIEAIAQRNKDILRDTTVTLRNDRYVLPVRTDKHRTVKGIVHGSSGTGATFFVEPAELVENGNDLVLAKEDVIHEENRILEQLRQIIKEQIYDVKFAVKTVIETEVRIAAARICWDIDAVLPVLGKPGTLELKDARHPVLVLDGLKVVTNDITLTPHKTLLISGPNAGGKTVVLKTAGILSLMQKAGLPISADPESVVGIPVNVLSDIGDDQSLSENLSTFSAHMKNISQMLDAAEEGSIVLLDELSAGTDPFEGAALAQAILDRFNTVGAATVSTTHFGAVKEHAQQNPAFEGAAMGFDAVKLKPTYKLKTGVTGHSSALSTAKQYGVPTSVIDAAVALLPKEVQKLNAAVENAEKEQSLLAAERLELADTLAQAKKQQKKLAVELATIKKNEQRFINKESEALWASIKSARQRVRDAETSIRRKRQDPALIKKMRNDINAVAKELESGGKLSTRTDNIQGRAARPEDIVKGAQVFILSMNHNGIVDSPLQGNTAYINVNKIRMRVPLMDMLITGGGKKTGTQKIKTKNLKSTKNRKPPFAALASDPIRTESNTLDLRGVRVDEGIDKTDLFLDEALKFSTDMVYILTGHGTGALMTGIRKYLKESPYVEKFRPGTKDEGGDAVTAVWLR